MTMTEIKGMGLDRPKRTLLANYSMAHMLVDAICVGGVLSLNTFSTMTTVQYTTTIVLYNVIAFGLQPFIGFFCDESQRDKTVALVGIGLVIISGDLKHMALFQTLLLLENLWQMVILWEPLLQLMRLRIHSPKVSNSLVRLEVIRYPVQ